MTLLAEERASVSSVTEPARAWRVHVAYDGAADVLSVALADDAPAFPVVVDPQYDTSFWVDASTHIPSPRSRVS